MNAEQQAAAPSPLAGRRGRVLEGLGSDADAILVTGSANVRYLSGFTGTSGWFLLGGDEVVFLTDPRYTAQAETQVSGARIEISTAGLPKAAARVIGETGLQRIAFESARVTVATATKLADTIDIEWVPVDGVVEEARKSKDAGEVEKVRAALAVTEDALLEVAGSLRPGQLETEIAAQLEYACRLQGAEGMAFETIVASGPRSALPHGVAGNRAVEAGEAVMIDMGCRLDGYCSDLTRMIWCGGSPSERWLEAYEVVDRARDAALLAVADGVAAVDVDAAARAVIEEAGYGEHFPHGTGHGVGLEIHEAPALSVRGTETLRAGMIVTIEPAVYFDGEFGIRIEDLIHVTDDGAERLTALDTEPILRGIS